MGPAAAPVTIEEFADIQCPYCAQVSGTVLPQVVDRWVRPGKAKMVFRTMDFLGDDSTTGALAAHAAARQDAMWPFVEVLYKNQGAENSGWVTDKLIDQILAEVPGLDASKVKVDAKSPAVTKEIKAVEAEAKALNVQGTPWFYIGIGVSAPYEVQVQSLTPEAFRPILDDALNG
jgi:protein-disulfide isomerase